MHTRVYKYLDLWVYRDQCADLHYIIYQDIYYAYDSPLFVLFMLVTGNCYPYPSLHWYRDKYSDCLNASEATHENMGNETT